MEPLAIGVCIVLVCVLVGWAQYWRISRARDMLDQWARLEGYELIAVERRLLTRGPFWWRTGKGQEVFRISVRDAEGGTRAGFARVGGFFLGLLSDRVDVRWD